MRFDSKEDYNGLFIPRDGNGAGQLVVAGKDTRLKLVGRDMPERPSSGMMDYHGVLADGAKASLLRCIWINRISGLLEEGEHHQLNIFPHYILVGKDFIESREPAIRALRYHFENVACLVNLFGTFGTMFPKPNDLRMLLEARHKRMEESARKRGSEPSPFEPEVGDDPVLCYFNGVWGIAECKAEIGTVKLVNEVSYGMAGPNGVRIGNTVTIEFVFSKLKTVDEAIEALWTLHGFFELCLGKRQRFLSIRMELEKDKAADEDEPAPLCDVLCSYLNERVSGEVESTAYGDILVDPGAQKEEFATVLAGWLNSNADMGDARWRFTNAFHMDHYSMDRIVGAANMFDLLPERYAPAKKELDQETLTAVAECRERFKALDDSFARQSVLSALGRVGSPTLRDKVCNRADVIIAADPDRFSGLHIPCTEAVRCRNHYVHGSPAAFDYHGEFKAFAFLTDTLEFVFGVSHLIELGWDYHYWRDKGSSMTHGFGSYMVDFNANMRRLETLLKN